MLASVILVKMEVLIHISINIPKPKKYIYFFNWKGTCKISGAGYICECLLGYSGMFSI